MARKNKNIELLEPEEKEDDLPLVSTSLGRKTMTKRTVPPEKFLGVWIPGDIYLSRELSRSEQILLAKIQSLQKKKGCFAGNEYFARFLNLSVGAVANMLTKLKRFNLIEDRGERNKRRLLFTTFDTIPEYSGRLKEELKTKKQRRKLSK
ncbi:hypothetical protein FACS1894152_5420 [Bacilli bacterium]|nr:hypothetical protein FACS1894152_5420 [Bacilli bacterium]